MSAQFKVDERQLNRQWMHVNRLKRFAYESRQFAAENPDDKFAKIIAKNNTDAYKAEFSKLLLLSACGIAESRPTLNKVRHGRYRRNLKLGARA